MTNICECIFEKQDPNNEKYSLTEYDLYPEVGPSDESYSIRRNFEEEVYEIFDFRHQDSFSDEAVWKSDEDLEVLIGYAADLEISATGSTEISYGCHPSIIQCEMEWGEAGQFLD